MTIEETLTSFTKELIGKDFEFRPYQLETIKSIVENVKNGTKQTVLEAPTGSGKSIIGIISAYALYKLYGMTSYILTSDLSLFAQYENDIKKLHIDCFGCIKGKDNYVCNENGCNVSQSICALRGLSPTSVSKSDAFDCKYKCEYVCNYTRAIHAPITLMTYQLYFIQRNYVEDGLFNGNNRNFPERDFVICDECHNICNICQSHFAPKISIRRPTWMDVLDRYSRNGLPEDSRKFIVNRILDCNDNVDLINEVCKYESYVGHYLYLNSVVRQKLAKKHKLSKIEKSALFAGNVARQEHCKLEDMVKFVQEFDAYKYAVKSIDSNGITLNFIYDNAMLKKYFHDKSKCELLMSATIGDFDEYAKLAGLDEKTYKCISMPSTFDFSKSQIYYSTVNRMSYAEKDESFQFIVPQVVDICKFYSNNRGIIQTGSYSNCDMLKMMLPNDIHDRCIFYKGSADKTLALAQFMKFGKEQNDNHILVGPTLIEGLDFPDDLCRFQICIKVPFAHLGNEYVRKKKDLVDGWYQYDALTKICQGIGRGIRHPNDWCKTYILDGCINSLVNKLENINALSGRFVEYECCLSSH